MHLDVIFQIKEKNPRQLIDVSLLAQCGQGQILLEFAFQCPFYNKTRPAPHGTGLKENTEICALRRGGGFA